MKAVLAGVVGWPVSHSLSPRMHQFWLREHGIAGTYAPLAVPRHDLFRAVKALQAVQFVGVNLTLPHKEAAYAIAHSADPPARAVEAANLLLFRDGRFAAYNTDAQGLLLSLREGLAAATVRMQQAVVLGAGGAARAAVLACDMLGVRRIVVLNRTGSRAEALAKCLRTAVTASLTATAISDWHSIASRTDLLVNATSAGLNGTPSPDIAPELLTKNAAVCDLVYNPLETPLLARARSLGLRTIDGLGMLMHQGALAFALLFGVRPDVSSTLRAHLEQALRDGI